MANIHQINAETMAVKSALFSLQANGWRVVSASDGHSTTNIRKASSQLRARKQAIEVAHAVDVATISLSPIENDADFVTLLIIWGNGAEDVVADIHGPSRLLDQVERILDI